MKLSRYLGYLGELRPVFVVAYQKAKGGRLYRHLALRRTCANVVQQDAGFEEPKALRRLDR